MALSLSPLAPHVGVEVVGASGSGLLRQSASEQCRELLIRYGVVVYRDSGLSDDQLIKFSSMLGQVVVAPTGEHQRPEIQTITLDPERTNPVMAAYRRGNFFWHIDGATDQTPQKGTLLLAREVDKSGEGGTEFASTYLAYETLSDDDKTLIENLQVVHSFAAAQQRANPDPTDEDRANWDRVPVRVHPLVWRRRDGRRSLLLGSTAAEVVGWRPEEGRALLDRLEAWATRPEVVLQHDWRKDDLVTWDNTGMLHRAMPFQPSSRRLMHRTTLAGEEGVA